MCVHACIQQTAAYPPPRFLLPGYYFLSLLLFIVIIHYLLLLLFIIDYLLFIIIALYYVLFLTVVLRLLLPGGGLRPRQAETELVGEEPVVGQSELRPISVLYKHYGFRRVRLEHKLNFTGWSSEVHREFPGKFESSNLSRGNLSRRTPNLPTKILPKIP